MFGKIIFISAGIFLFSYNLARAEVIINEIMYAPANGSNYEWVEIFNSGATPVDLQGWRFFHGENNSGPLTLRNGNTTVLQPSEYAIIAKSPSVVTNYAWLNFSGMILSASTLSLPDGMENTYIAIASDTIKTISNSLVYDTGLGGNKDSGNSLQLISGLWKAVSPTPGKKNETANTFSLSDEEGSNSSGGSEVVVNSSTQGSPEPKTKTVETPKIKIKITAKTLVFIGIPVEFSASATGYSNEPLAYGRYFWNFGDGDSKEIEANNMPKFTHTFFYEGEYAVALEYYMNHYSENPNASDQIIIKVIPANISISRVGDEKDFFVEISNDTSYYADLSKWVLLSGEKSFTFPKNTILGPKKKIILSPKITNFSISDRDTLRLANSQWETVFGYSSLPVEPVKILAKNSISKISKSNLDENSPAVKPPLGSSTAKSADEQVPTDNLGAMAVKSDLDVSNSTDNFKYGIWGLFALLGISASAAYLIRVHNRKIVPNKAGDDFEIIDE